MKNGKIITIEELNEYSTSCELTIKETEIYKDWEFENDELIKYDDIKIGGEYKMKKKLLYLLCGILVLGTITGCGNNSLKTENGSDVLGGGTTTNTKGNCTVLECIKKINPEHTVEQINDIIGFEGELLDEKYQKYYWELSEDTGVQVAYYSSSKGQISIDYDKNYLANSKVDFSRYSELKSIIEGTDGITYNDFITYIGNVQGAIVEKSSSSTKYVWVSADGSYLNGSFSNYSGKCTFASGMIK